MRQNPKRRSRAQETRERHSRRFGTRLTKQFESDNLVKSSGVQKENFEVKPT